MIHDLNCDLGEGEPVELTAELMQHLSSANIACGGHAGSRETILGTLDLAMRCQVQIGAHPGLPGAFGRNKLIALSPRDFEDLLLNQVGSFRELVREAGGNLHHIKLHGALYHWSDEHAEILLHTVQKHWPGLIIYARAGGAVARQASDFSLEVWPEGFLDRGYLQNQTLVPRGQPGDLQSLEASQVRLQAIKQNQPIPTVDGGVVNILPRTWCVHSDSPHALELLRAARPLLSRM